jgi:hypothetical protein
MSLTFREILETHPVASLRRHIRRSNINGYGRLDKPSLINLIITYADRFQNISAYMRPPSKPITIRERAPRPKAPVRIIKNANRGPLLLKYDPSSVSQAQQAPQIPQAPIYVPTTTVLRRALTNRQKRDAPKKPRSPAQIAATRKLVESNEAKRNARYINVD